MLIALPWRLILHGKSDAFAIDIHGQYPDLHVLANFYHVVGVFDESIG